jgi:hypothetical protein
MRATTGASSGTYRTSRASKHSLSAVKCGSSPAAQNAITAEYTACEEQSVRMLT